jgi:ABC-type transport system substrate-binding protein
VVAPEALAVQATVVGKMLEQAGFPVTREVLAPTTFNQKVLLSKLDQPAERQAWDIALTSYLETLNFPPFLLYNWFALGGPFDWVEEEAELGRLYQEVLRSVEHGTQEGLIRQMERHAHDRAYFLFLYNPISLYAVNKAVELVPYGPRLIFAETALTDRHWSARPGAAKP